MSKNIEKEIELIKVTTNEEGQQLVNARELYLGLGLDASQWSRWSNKNIKDNEYFVENKDWCLLDTMTSEKTRGNFATDYAISLDFAKHLAMMARTEKSHAYRQYFIACEKKLKNPFQNLSKELQAVFVIDNKVQRIEKDVLELKNNMTIDSHQQYTLKSLANDRVVTVLGGKKAPAYKELSSKLFSNFWREYQKRFVIPSYRDTLKKDFENAKDYINNWKPQKDYIYMIAGANAQGTFL